MVGVASWRRAVGSLTRLDALVREMTPEESRRLFRTYLVEYAELSSHVHSLKSGRAQVCALCWRSGSTRACHA